MMNLTEFIYESNKLKTEKAVIDCFLKFINEFNLEYFIMREVSSNFLPAEKCHFEITTNYPEKWLERYAEKNYIEYDPVYHKALRYARPFTWSEAQKEYNTRRSRQVMEEAAGFNLRNGVGVSFFLPGGRQIGMGLSSSRERISADKYSLDLLYSGVVQFYMVFSSITNVRDSPGKECFVSITEREKEVLHWLSCGKVKSQVAEILCVSESCIKRHCENIFRKLDASSLVSAVITALRLGLITLF